VGLVFGDAFDRAAAVLFKVEFAACRSLSR
jgi:hypothetical protein